VWPDKSDHAGSRIVDDSHTLVDDRKPIIVAASLTTAATPVTPPSSSRASSSGSPRDTNDAPVGAIIRVWSAASSTEYMASRQHKTQRTSWLRVEGLGIDIKGGKHLVTYGGCQDRRWDGRFHRQAGRQRRRHLQGRHYGIRRGLNPRKAGSLSTGIQAAASVAAVSHEWRLARRRWRAGARPREMSRADQVIE
jgi:hypothetical protein